MSASPSNAAVRRDRIETLGQGLTGGGITTSVMAGLLFNYAYKHPNLYSASPNAQFSPLFWTEGGFLLAGAGLLWLGRTLPEQVKEQSPLPMALLTLILLLRLGTTGLYFHLGVPLREVLPISFVATTYLFYMMASIRRVMVDPGETDGQS